MFGEGFLVDIWNGSYTDPLILSEEERNLKTRLEHHVYRLASEIGARNTAKPDAMEAAAQYIESVFRDAGLEERKQQFHTADGAGVRNIEAVIEGNDPKAECLIVGAHYDSVACPGANDNASAVAALLEIAGAISRKGKPQKTIRFVAFANEEPPYFGGADMGSWVYARNLVQTKVEILGMICLEDIGYYSTEPGSQKIPDLLKGFTATISAILWRFAEILNQRTWWRGRSTLSAVIVTFHPRA